MNRFKAILCVMQQGKDCELTFKRSVSLAETNQASLKVITVSATMADMSGTPLGSSISADIQTAIKDTQEQWLQTLITPYQNRLTIQAKALIGTPFLEIIREVLRHGHDLVIKSVENQDWLDRIFGSDDMHLMRKCPCPVWLIKPQAPDSYQRILAAVDVDDAYPAKELAARHQQSIQILEMATSLALSDSAELHVAHAWEAIGEQSLRNALAHTPEDKIAAYVAQVKQHRKEGLAKLLNEVTKNLGKDALDYLKPQKHLVKGWARKEIPLLAKRIKADLVVMGTVARTGIPGFLMGNTAETILNQIDCSVLAIKPPGFVTPVTVRS
ncbi:MAG: universal stress protein [Pseudomonadales bacterium]|nr:universal stress protein [Pseudomonadales bacterium]